MTAPDRSVTVIGRCGACGCTVWLTDEVWIGGPVGLSGEMCLSTRWPGGYHSARMPWPVTGERVAALLARLGVPYPAQGRPAPARPIGLAPGVNARCAIG